MGQGCQSMKEVVSEYENHFRTIFETHSKSDGNIVPRRPNINSITDNWVLVVGFFASGTLNNPEVMLRNSSKRPNCANCIYVLHGDE